MTTKAQDAVIDGMAADGTVFVKPLQILGREYSAVAACVLDDDSGRRISPWSLIAEDGVVLRLVDDALGPYTEDVLPTEETT